MSKNKMSVWAIIILVATIIATVLLITSVVTTIVGIPAIGDAARQAALNDPELAGNAETVATFAVAGVVVAMVFASVLDILKIIGGFMFSLKGRWGMFCIIVSIISIATGVWDLVSAITNKSGVASIIVCVLSLLVSILLCVACFKHRAENK